MAQTWVIKLYFAKGFKKIKLLKCSLNTKVTGRELVCMEHFNRLLQVRLQNYVKLVKKLTALKSQTD